MDIQDLTAMNIDSLNFSVMTTYLHESVPRSAITPIYQHITASSQSHDSHQHLHVQHRFDTARGRKGKALLFVELSEIEILRTASAGTRVGGLRTNTKVPSSDSALQCPHLRFTFKLLAHTSWSAEGSRTLPPRSSPQPRPLLVPAPVARAARALVSKGNRVQ